MKEEGVAMKEGGVSAQVRRWLLAMRWKRRVERALEGSGLTFRQWLVITALDEVYRRTGDAVSQNQVARHLELPRNAVSEVMLVLEDGGWVDRDCSASGRALRIYLTREAKGMLRKHAERIAIASLIDD